MHPLAITVRGPERGWTCGQGRECALVGGHPCRRQARAPHGEHRGRRLQTPRTLRMPRRQLTARVGEAVEKRGPSHSAAGCKRRLHKTVWKLLQVLTEHGISTWPSKSTPRYTPTGHNNRCAHGHLWHCYSQKPRNGNHPTAPRQARGHKKCSLDTAAERKESDTDRVGEPRHHAQGGSPSEQDPL